jgi:hypothetical protein
MNWIVSSLTLPKKDDMRMMKKRMTRGRTKNGFKPENVEPILDRALRPVVPRPEFVGGLRKQLAIQAPPVKSGPSAWQYLLWVGAGLVSGVVLILAGLRAATALLVALGVIQQVKKIQQPSDSSLRPAL